MEQAGGQKGRDGVLLLDQLMHVFGQVVKDQIFCRAPGSVCTASLQSHIVFQREFGCILRVVWVGNDLTDHFIASPAMGRDRG